MSDSPSNLYERDQQAYLYALRDASMDVSDFENELLAWTVQSAGSWRCTRRRQRASYWVAR
jgi:hypothetical protein